MVSEIELQKKARWVRLKVLDMVYKARHGHIGGSFSSTEILIALYYLVLKEDDEFILSKGHACDALYAILADKGIIPMEELDTFCQKGSRLEGHPSIRVPGIRVSSGSLGNGLGIGAGLALAKKMDGKGGRVFVLVGDSECQEGSIWESAMFASSQRLNNLVAIIDRNHLGVLGNNDESLEPLVSKWNAFGWGVITILDGHDFNSLVTDLNRRYSNYPTTIIASTVKGKGVSFMEHNPVWHAGVPNKEEYEKAKAELSA